MPANPPNPDPAERWGISIIVPVSRSRTIVENLVGSIEEAMPRKPRIAVQLILVGRPPAEVSSRHPDLRIEKLPIAERHPGIRRNRGLTRAVHEVAALLDDDVLVTRSWFETVIREYHREGFTGILTGPSDLPYSGELGERFSEALTNSTLSPFRSSHRTRAKKPVSSRSVEFCNCVLTRSVWAALGGFDEEGDWRIDDTLFCVQAAAAGVELVNHPGLTVAHRRGGFPLPYYRWVWYEKFHQGKVFVHYPFVFGWDPCFLGLFLLTGAALALTAVFSLRWIPPAATAFLVLAYALRLKAARRDGFPVFLLTPPLLLLSYLAAGGGFYSGLVYGLLTRRSVSPVVETIRRKLPLSDK